MTEDLTRTLAFAFRKKGVDAMERSRLLHLLAFDLRWFSPDPAKRLILKAIESGHLEEDGDRLRLGFDEKTIEVPLNFRPDASILDSSPAPRVRAPVPAPPPAPVAAPPAGDAPALGLDGIVSAEVAALVAARRQGEDVRAQAAALEKRMLGA